ncbi:hypothetical protein J4474_01410 [Candidatus Pacearchaeota archaeon]|nr:hypothetical protein [Candidatus Pacearchaeota archaeon]
MNKKYWIAGIIVIIALGIYFFSLKSNPSVPEELAKCLGGNSTLYTKTNCYYCEKQKEIFGDSYAFLHVLNFDTWEEIAKYNITETPTWVINNQKYSGVQSIEKLKELTGC